MKIKGTKKADLLSGTHGDDAIYGKRGADHLWGSEGNDKLYGGRGNDKLYGNEGTDVLKGGKGRDTFFIETGDFDKIKDFQPGKDKVVILDPGVDGPVLPLPVDDFGYDGAVLTYKGEPIVKVEHLSIDHDVALI